MTKSKEHSAGTILIRCENETPAVLLIRIRRDVFEIPKGHVETGETTADAALRELREETGIESEVIIGPHLDRLEYEFSRDSTSVLKRVDYFLAFPRDGAEFRFGKKPPNTREIRWVTASEIETLPLTAESLRPLIRKALESPFRKTKCSS